MTFEDAVRAYFDVPGDWLVGSEMEGGREFQLGDYTWDTEPYVVVITARPPTPKATWLADAKRYEEWKKASFDSLPELWAALVKEG